MGDPGIAAVLDRLRSPEASAAWEEFLHQYSPVLYQAARAYNADPDVAADCYVNICEHLSRNGFRRLLRFKREGSASFTTWLRVVARNLCFDWYRSRAGRRRPFKSLQHLSELELEIYRCRFEHALSEEETLHRLRPIFPELGCDQLAEVERRIEHSLNSRQRWILSTRKDPAFSARVALLTEEGEEKVAQVADTRLDQESLMAGQQQQARLKRCVGSLPPDERLLLQLRFEEDLSLDEIARLTGLGDAQRVHRQIGAILKKLRGAMG